MSLILRKTSQWWYAYFRLNGTEKVISLKIKVYGVRPASLREQGDAAFEQSRGRAMAAHDKLEKELLDERNVIQLTEKLIALKTEAGSPPSLTSSSTKQKAPRKRVLLEFVGLQRYGLGGAAKSAAKPNLRS